MRTKTIERRVTVGEVELRQQGSKTVIEGHAAVWDRLSQNLGGFVENIRTGAFTKTLKEADVRALLNHDPNLVLGRNTSGTLELSEDSTGLSYRIIPPDTSYANDLVAVMERGDINQSSFAFYTIEDGWGLTEQGFPVRTLIEVQLVDVSPVTFPAFLDTDSGVSGRMAALAGLAKRSGCDVAALNEPEAIKRAVSGDNEPQTPCTRDRWLKRRADVLATLSNLDD